MAYEPTNWKAGDVVTSAKLNKLEQGVAGAGGTGGVFIVHRTESSEEFRLDKTWLEILSALTAEQLVAVCYATNDDGSGNPAATVELATEAYYNDEKGVYNVHVGDLKYHTSNPNNYPTVSGGGK